MFFIFWVVILEDVALPKLMMAFELVTYLWSTDSHNKEPNKKASSKRPSESPQKLGFSTFPVNSGK